MMRKSTDTLSRQWALLRAVPTHPHWQSTRELHQRVWDQGHEVNIRTIQRDLNFLSAPFPLLSETRGKTLYWQWMEGSPGLEIPAMSQSTALVFQLANQYLRLMMPAGTLGLLSPYLERASMALTNSKLSDWNDKIVSLERGPLLTPPETDEDIRKVVYRALLEGRRLEVEYVPRYETESSVYPVNPLGIVLRDGVIYLVCTIWEYADVRQLALHRMKDARLLEEEANAVDGFNLRRYVCEESGFGYPESAKTIKLEALFNEGAAFHLTERKLSEDQTLKKTAGGSYRLTATVADTSELRWWLLSFGDGVEVIAPKGLRKEFKGVAEAMAQSYL
jgi:predicted DNA-binding transcriptional regulator YafY